MSKDFADFLGSEGIIHETSVLDTPQQNRLTECMQQTIWSGIHTILHHLGLKNGFWSEALAIITHIINCALSGTIAPFTHFSLFFPLFCSLTHIPLSQPVMSLFILIFHPLLCACTCDIQPARGVSFFPLFPDHVINHLITMCLPHGFVVTDPIAPSQSVPLLVSMFVLCWKPNTVRAQCTFSIYSLSPS